MISSINFKIVSKTIEERYFYIVSKQEETRSHSFLKPKISALLLLILKRKKQ